MRRQVGRRDFLSTAGAIALAGFPFTGITGRLAALPPWRPPNRSLGIQLYTLRELLKKDFEGTIAALARIGYGEVELAGIYGRRPIDVRKVLDRNHISAPSGHCDIPAITERLDQTIADAQVLGHRYVVVAWIPEEQRTPDGYTAVAEQFNRAGEKLRKAGLALGYHNHDFEFAAPEGEQCGYDILLDRTQPDLLTMELDLFWIRKGGRDALRYFAQYPGRFRMVHVKDMAADGSMVDVGAGAMDWGTLLAAADQAGVKHWFAEHDDAKDPLTFARISYDYLKHLKLADR